MSGKFDEEKEILLRREEKNSSYGSMEITEKKERRILKMKNYYKKENSKTLFEKNKLPL